MASVNTVTVARRAGLISQPDGDNSLLYSAREIQRLLGKRYNEAQTGCSVE